MNRFMAKLHGTRSLSNLSAQEAGKRAEALASQLSARRVSLPTLVAHAGIENVHNAPLSPPIHVATTYTRPADGVYLEFDTAYAREDNPTRLLLEKTIFELETSGLDISGSTSENIEPTSLAFSSGMMAATAVILAHSTPLTIFLPRDLYHGVPTLLLEIFSRHSVDVRRVDMTGPISTIVDEIQAVDSKFEVIVWMESPSNPLCEIVDIAAVTQAMKAVKSHKITTVVDVTMASPIVTRPLEVRRPQPPSSKCFMLTSVSLLHLTE
jgi:cystathionine gamma-synthase